MTLSQRLAIRASEIRTRLTELAGIDDLTDEHRGEIGKLRDEYRDVETRIQAATVADDSPEPREERAEDRELGDLISRSSMGAIFESTVEHREPNGAERELQEHYGLAPNQVPLVMLRRTGAESADLETRAVTPAPANVGAMQAEIIPGVFPMSCAAYMGVDMPSVPVGDAVFPVLTTNANAGVPAEGAEQSETTGSFSAETLSPSRIQASFFYSREDRARFRGMGESLRMNLSDALSDKLDAEIINGTNGLLTATNLPNNIVTEMTDFEAYRTSLVYSRIDGTFAAMSEDIRLVMGSVTYAAASSVYRSNTADDSALDSLMRITSGVKVSAHVPAAQSKRQNVIVRRGMRRDMVAPIWEGVTLIPDEITKAASGEIVVTAVMLHAVRILRAAGFHKQQIQMA